VLKPAAGGTHPLLFHLGPGWGGGGGGGGGASNAIVKVTLHNTVLDNRLSSEIYL
jgi:hypothetical protein